MLDVDDDELDQVVQEALRHAAELDSDFDPIALEGQVRNLASIAEIGFPAWQMDIERRDRKWEVLQVFLPHMAEGIGTWPELFVSLTADDRAKLTALCGDDTLETVAYVLELVPDPPVDPPRSSP